MISDVLEISNTLALEAFLVTVDIKKRLILLITASYSKFFENLDSVWILLVRLKRFKKIKDLASLTEKKQQNISN